MPTTQPPRRSTVIAERRLKIAEMYMRERNEDGSLMTQEDIARKLGCDASMVSRHLKKLRALWGERAVKLFGEVVGERLMELEAVKREAWCAWHDSKKQHERTRTAQEQSGRQVTKLRAEVMKEAGSGDASYLNTVIAAIKEQNELQGIYPPRKIAPTNPEGTEPWAGFVAQQQAVIVAGLIDAMQQEDTCASTSASTIDG